MNTGKMESSSTDSDSCDVVGPESEPYKPEVENFVKYCIPKLFPGNNSVSVSVLLTGDDEVTDLNDRFRNTPKPTDVLSFEDGMSTPDGVLHAGEIAISVPFARRTKEDRSLDEYILFLVAHGLLHLSGVHHDDEVSRNKVIEMGESLLKGYYES